MANWLESSPAFVADQQARIFATYSADERAARGLRPGDSLDVEIRYVDGKPVSRVLPLAEAVTRAYTPTTVSDDGLLAAIPLDAYAEAQHGRNGIDLSAKKDEAALDPRIKAKLPPPDVASSQPSR